MESIWQKQSYDNVLKLFEAENRIPKQIPKFTTFTPDIKELNKFL